MMRVIPADSRIRECIEIRKKVFVEEQGVPVELEVDEMDSPGSGCLHFLLIDDEGRPFGTFRGYFEDEKTVHLQRFCILKEHRSKGMGREAFRCAADIFSDRGAEKLTFGAQCSAIGFYEKCGCRVVSDLFMDAGIPHRTMEYSL